MARISRWLSAVVPLLLLGSAAAQAPLPITQLTPQTPLAPSAIPAFVNQLPVLDVTPEPAWATYPKIATVTPAELAAAGGPYTLRMCEFTANVLPTGTFAPGVAPATHVWGYAKGTCPTTRETYLGPVFVNLRGTPTSIRYVNDLPLTPEASGVIAYRDGIDQTLHWADPNGLMCSMAGMAPNPACNWPFRGTGIPAVPHLHGGEVPPMLDGGPDAWFTSDGAKQGPAYYTSPALAPAAPNEAVYTYPNTQEAAPLWFHDHTLGATRLNVFAGLAGGYYLVDPAQDIPASLQDVTQVVPLVLQDRMFDTNGELFFTSDSKGGLLWALNPEHPYWNPEFVGDTIVVNGKAWPYLQVEQKRYRFLFLNGSNARTYELYLVDRKSKVKGPPLYVIGTDGGYLDSAVEIDPNALKPAATKLVIMPGERYEIVVDFSAVPAGSSLWLKNVAKTPYPGGATPTGMLGTIVEFRVTGPATVPGLAYDPATTPAIRGTTDPAAKITPLVNFATGTSNVPYQRVRQLTLNEVMGAPVLATDPVTGVQTAFPGGPLEILVNNTKWSGASARNTPPPDPANPPPSFRGDFVQIGATYYSELPQEGETELWEIVNLTADSHPIHLHLVQFQLLNRQSFDVPKYGALYGSLFPPVLDAQGNPIMIGMNTCSGAVYCPGYGPPLDYFTGTPGKWGGNPDVLGSLKSVPMPAALQETGWKDTVQAPPGMVTRVVVRWSPTEAPATAPAASLAYPFDPSGVVGPQQFGYVWHCHIIDHEDNEMMRPDVIQANTAFPAAGRPLVQGVAY
jgi:FtsP/CotA-like multicopper oxidase with cupredoxin domain